MKASMKKINEHIEKKYGKGIEFVKGRGYFYFSTRTNLFIESIYVYALNQMDLDGWIHYVDGNIDDALEDRGYEVRKNLMSGKPFIEHKDTPISCSPASETYWSM